MQHRVLWYSVKYHNYNYLSNVILSFFTILYINCLQERAGGGEGVVLNREITITNNLIYFLNLSRQFYWVKVGWSKPGTSLRLCFCSQSNLCNHHYQFIKKNKEEENSLVCYTRYCYTTAFRDVCNLIIITCAYDARISREREFPSYLISIKSLCETYCPFSVN
jgi:hypothetical protein